MEIKYNATGQDRKRLVKTIAEATGAESKYLGAPTMAYLVDYFEVIRDGTLVFDDRADSEEVEAVLEAIAEAGFECEDREKQTGLTIEIPFDKVNAGNLLKQLEAKGALIKKALGVDDIHIEMKEDRIAFPWFEKLPSPEEVKAFPNLSASSVNSRQTPRESPQPKKKSKMKSTHSAVSFFGWVLSAKNTSSQEKSC